MTLYRPKDFLKELGVSANTLRLWSNEFAPLLSPSAQAQTSDKGTPLQRRYTAEDIALFYRAQELLKDGLTYEQIRQALASEPPTDAVFEAMPDAPAEPTTALALPERNGHDPLAALVDALNRQEAALKEQSDLLRQLVALQSRPWYRKLLG